MATYNEVDAVSPADIETAISEAEAGHISEQWNIAFLELLEAIKDGSGTPEAARDYAIANLLGKTIPEIGQLDSEYSG